MNLRSWPVLAVVLLHLAGTTGCAMGADASSERQGHVTQHEDGEGGGFESSEDTGGGGFKSSEDTGDGSAGESFEGGDDDSFGGDPTGEGSTGEDEFGDEVDQNPTDDESAAEDDGFDADDNADDGFDADDNPDDSFGADDDADDGSDVNDNPDDSGEPFDEAPDEEPDPETPPFTETDTTDESASPFGEDEEDQDDTSPPTTADEVGVGSEFTDTDDKPLPADMFGNNTANNPAVPLPPKRPAQNAPQSRPKRLDNPAAKSAKQDRTHKAPPKFKNDKARRNYNKKHNSVKKSLKNHRYYSKNGNYYKPNASRPGHWVKYHANGQRMKRNVPTKRLPRSIALDGGPRAGFRWCRIGQTGGSRSICDGLLQLAR